MSDLQNNNNTSEDSAANEPLQASPNETAKPELSEIDSLRAELTGQIEALKRNNDELLKEKRTEKEKRQQVELDAQKNAKELALKNGDYEQLLKSSESENQKLAEKLAALEGRIAEEKVTTVALQMANEIAFDADAADLLKDYIAKRLKYTEEGVKILNQDRELTVSTLDDLKAEFVANSKFKALLKGSKAAGGSPTNLNDSLVSASKNQEGKAKLNPVQKLMSARN